jgi:hypothetical protein
VNKQYGIDARHEATSDCLYAKSLGSTALNEFLSSWLDEGYEDIHNKDMDYYLALKEISDKLSTPECLLEN